MSVTTVIVVFSYYSYVFVCLMICGLLLISVISYSNSRCCWLA